MKYFVRIQKLSLYILACSLFVFSSCKKEYETIKKPYNEIKRFAMSGYASLDSLHATIVGNEIVVNWSATAPLPEKIKPVIRVSAGATISPVSGTEVDFKDGTSYTVTAEDGTERVYKLKINSMEAIPKLLAISPATGLSWADYTVVNLTGEYFLAGGGASNIKAYLQRKKDGVEVDLPLVETLLRQTTMRVNMPTYNAACDTGWHKIWLKVGNQASQGIDTYIAQPMMRNVTITSDFVQKGQTVAIGQNLKVTYTMTDNYAGAVTRYYLGKFNAAWATVNVGNTRPSFEMKIVSVTNSEITFSIPESAAVYAGSKISQIHFRAPRPIEGQPDYTEQHSIDLSASNTFLQ